MKKLSLVISVYNEEAVLEKFYNAFCNIEQDLKYGGENELIFVNDGSTDASMNILEVIAQQNKNVRVISFSRNFGHEAAMIAGIDPCCGGCDHLHGCRPAAPSGMHRPHHGEI